MKNELSDNQIAKQEIDDKKKMSNFRNFVGLPLYFLIIVPLVTIASIFTLGPFFILPAICMITIPFQNYDQSQSIIKLDRTPQEIKEQCSKEKFKLLETFAKYKVKNFENKDILELEALFEELELDIDETDIININCLKEIK